MRRRRGRCEVGECGVFDFGAERFARDGASRHVLGGCVLMTWVLPAVYVSHDPVQE